MNPLSDVMGGWGIWETVNGERQLTTECIENVIMMVPFSAVVAWTFRERIGNNRKKILWQSGKIAFIFSISIEMLQLFLRLGDAILGDWNNKYKTVLEPFLKRMPDKTFHYVASYMLKGYAMEKKGIAEKYRATSYKSLKRKISSLSDILDNAYGKSYCQISNPTLIGNVVNLGIDNANKRKSRDVTHSFGMKLRALMLGKEVEITFCDVQRTKKKYKFTDEERLSFVLFGILYASRCNNFHGNVAARMNSINANKDTFKMYTDMFLAEYIILAIHLNSQGALSDVVLNKVKKNANLMV